MPSPLPFRRAGEAMGVERAGMPKGGQPQYGDRTAYV
jgi:hypothetical protein